MLWRWRRRRLRGHWLLRCPRLLLLRRLLLPWRLRGHCCCGNMKGRAREAAPMAIPPRRLSAWSRRVEHKALGRIHIQKPLLDRQCVAAHGAYPNAMLLGLHVLEARPAMFGAEQHDVHDFVERYS